MEILMCLKWWSWLPLAVYLDSVTGAAHLRFARCGHKIRGNAWKTGGEWYLLRVLNDELVLQMRDRVLRLSDIKGMSLTREGRRRRRVHIETAEGVIEVVYRSPADYVWNRLDPTFDGLDEEMSDFFVRVLRVWESESCGSELVKAWSGED